MTPITLKQVRDLMKWRESRDPNYTAIATEFQLKDRWYMCRITHTDWNYRCDIYVHTKPLTEPGSPLSPEFTIAHDTFEKAIDWCIAKVIGHAAEKTPMHERANRYMEFKKQERLQVVPLTIGQPLTPILVNRDELERANPLKSPLPTMEE